YSIAIGEADKRNDRGRSETNHAELFLYAQIEFCERGTRVCAPPRRLWNDGRSVRGTHANANRQNTHCTSCAIGPATRKILGNMDAISYQASAQVRLHFGGRLRVFQNQAQRAGRRGGDHTILQDLPFGALGRGALYHPSESSIIGGGNCRSEQAI